MRLPNTTARALTLAVLGLLLPLGAAEAQITVAKGGTPPDDTPSFRVGTTIFTNYTYTDEPTTKDASGNTINPSSFEVTRAYINVQGNLHHLLTYRVTPDISGRLTSTLAAPAAGQSVTTNYNGSLVFRLKYAFGQLNLDDWLPKGSWVRIGQQQTPYLDFLEGIYRYRFQGTMFPEREGLITSSDPGISAHINVPNNYGDVHLGYYNGDGYGSAEANDQKAFQIRGTIRPLARTSIWKGLRLTGFYDSDHPVKDLPRERFIATGTFEYKYLNLGVDWVNSKTRAGLTANEVKTEGYSFWLQPRTKIGIEGFLRYDSYKPASTVTTPVGISVSSSAKKNTLIAGVSYWFKTTGPATASVFADYEQVKFDTVLNTPNQKRFALHTLFAF